MKAVVRELETSDLSRASQLCQRTNQFNLTTKRYTDSELAGLMSSDDRKVFVLEAEDRFGPMGMTGLIIYSKLADAIEIDTFLLSCRIIGRHFDRVLFRRSLDLVSSSWPHKEIRSSFIPTAKNGVVVDLWQDYGFTATSSNDSTEYFCPSATVTVNLPIFIEVE